MARRTMHRKRSKSSSIASGISGGRSRGRTIRLGKVAKKYSPYAKAGAKKGYEYAKKYATKENVRKARQSIYTGFGKIKSIFKKKPKEQQRITMSIFR